MRTPRHRLADSADTKEKCSLLLGFARDQFLLKRKGRFSLVFCPPSIRTGGGATTLSPPGRGGGAPPPPPPPIPPTPPFRHALARTDGFFGKLNFRYEYHDGL